jgi:hypothetical protein
MLMGHYAALPTLLAGPLDEDAAAEAAACLLNRASLEARLEHASKLARLDAELAQAIAGCGVEWRRALLREVANCSLDSAPWWTNIYRSALHHLGLAPPSPPAPVPHVAGAREHLRPAASR